MSNRYTEEECIFALRCAATVVNGYLSKPKYSDLEISPSYGTISSIFGTWTEAKKEAGLQTDSRGRKKKHTKSECIKEIRRVNELVDGTLTVTEYKEHADISSNSVVYRLGSWENAKKEAGIERTTTRVDSDTIEFTKSRSGYPEIIHIPEGEPKSNGERVLIHRLSAIAEHGIEAVNNAEHIHHKDRARINSGRENLKLMSKSDHCQLHADDLTDIDDTSYREKSTLLWLYVELGMTIKEITDSYEATRETIEYWMDRHDILSKERGPTAPTKQKPSRMNSDTVDCNPQASLGDFTASQATAD